MAISKDLKIKFHNELREGAAKIIELLDQVEPGSDSADGFSLGYECLQLELKAKWLFKCLTDDTADEDE